ncbi:MAG: hypothetical protein IT182_16410 [Acidobacteria bacterium]|nr:hypothetical protein [Acidobacteriota bacterium]
MTGLLLVACLAFAHAAAYAVWKPLYQVSDEVVYLTVVQTRALALTNASAAACIAPPTGQLPAISPSGKRGFVYTTARELALLCGAGVTNRTLIALRLLQALSLPVIAVCAWAIAHLLTQRRTDALLAGLLVAGHPVAATVAGAVTPDAWANAFSAIAFLSATRAMLGRGSRWDVGTLIASVLLAVSWKDTATFLLILPPCVLAIGLWRGTRQATAARWIAGMAVAAPLMVAAGLFWFRSPYLGQPTPTDIPRGPGAWAHAVLYDFAEQLPGMVNSSWMGIGSFGANVLTAGPFMQTIGVALVVAGVIGGSSRWARSVPQPGIAAIAAVWTLCALICAVQPSVRQVLLGTTDIHQGRWLFPLLAPFVVVVACGINGLSARWHPLPLATMGVAVAAMQSLVDTARYFWASPADLVQTALFVRGTGGAVVGDGVVLATIRHVAEQTPFTWRAASTLLVIVAATACLVHGTGLRKVPRDV